MATSKVFVVQDNEGDSLKVSVDEGRFMFDIYGSVVYLDGDDADALIAHLTETELGE